jgi:single-stranded DNA-binding protein
MTTLNKIILIGNVESNPVDKVTTDGLNISEFNLLVKRPARADGLESQSDLIPIVARGQIAEKTSGLNTGSSILIEGHVYTKVIEEPNGKRKWLHEVEARQINILDSIATESAATKQPDLASDTETDFEPKGQNVLEQIPSKKEIDFKFDENLKLDKNISDVPEFDGEIEEDIPF